MQTGTLTLHRFNGDEVFAISEATALARPEGDQVVLYLDIETDGHPLKTLPDTEKLFAQPNAEVTIYLSRDELSSLAGRRFTVPRPWDDAIGDHVSRICYCEHEGLDDNEIEFVERQGELIRVRWTGKTTDVNFYDGSKPPTRVVIEGWFTCKGSAWTETT